MIYKMPFAGKWLEVDSRMLEDWRRNGKREQAEAFEAQWQEYCKCPISMFLPHGVAWTDREQSVCEGKVTWGPSPYPKEWRNDGAAFLNDWKSDGALLLGPNQAGKSTHLVVWTALRILPCNPEWMIFKDHGVEYHEWEGPKTWVIASYSWDNVTTIWRRVKEAFPKDELGKYADYDLSFGDGRPKQLLCKCGSRLVFLCYTQRQHHWEGFTCDGGSFDEQVPREKWVGWSRGTTTRGHKTPFGMALTGHVLADRPDTGASGWIKTDLVDDRNRMGREIGIYRLSIDTTPDAIIMPEKKKLLWRQYVDPSVTRSEQDQRIAVARYWGGFEEGSGLVFDGDVWQRNLHVINPLWEDQKCPTNATKWRVIDYGTDKGITAVSWWAVAPLRTLIENAPSKMKDVPEELLDEVFAVLYRLMYDTGMEIAEVVECIVRMSRNERSKVGDEYDQRTGNAYQIWEEQQVGEAYWGGTLLDSRSAGQPQQGQTLAEIFARYGLQDVRSSCGQRDDVQIPRLKDWLRLDYSKPHPWARNDDGTKMYGCPRLFFFEDNTVDAVSEIELLGKAKEGSNSLIDKRCAHHFIDTAKWWASEIPRFMGDVRKDDDIADTARKNNPYTAY